MSGAGLSFRISLYALRLTGRAAGRYLPWVLAAPLAGLPLDLLSRPLGALGIVGSFIRGFLVAGLLSLVLFIGRSIIEQRRLQISDITHGLGAFFGDVMNVLFALWLVSLAGTAIPPLTWAALFALAVLPVFEMVALAPVGGFGVFGAAWRFVNRDGVPWLLAQWPAVLLVLGGLWGGAAVKQLLPALPLPLEMAAWMAVDYLVQALVFVAFLYRGVLFLALDSVAPHARAARFGAR